MRKAKIFNSGILFLSLVLILYIGCFAQETASNEPAALPREPATDNLKTKSPSVSQNVTLDFNEADIHNVLKIISYKSGVNIVTTPEVIGNVTIRLEEVPWERALDIILKTYGFGSERQGNIILVTKMENISKIQSEEPLKTELFSLKFLDAQDAQRALIPMLSPRGKISVLYSKGQKGWKFGTFKIGEQESSEAMKREEEKSTADVVSVEKSPTGELLLKKAEFAASIKSKTLIVTDTSSALDKIKNFIELIDKKPKQVLIETKIMEINTDKLKDLGIDWGTGSAGASSYATAPTDISVDSKNRKSIAGRNLASELTPSLFGPKEGTTTFPGTYPYKAGLEVLFKKLGGTQFEVILHALEQNAHTNTLSAPRIMTLDNQEASILIGYHTPILKSTVTAGSATTGTGATITQDLKYYQEIGIRLNVVPQVSEEGYINMIIHPSVTSSSSSVSATSTASGETTTTTYPIIDVREAQTQVIMKDGETIVIGGLMKDVKSKETIGIPFLSKIPFIGNLFKRETIDTGKVDLLIFITARIIKDDEFSPEAIARLEEKMERNEKNEVAVKLNKPPVKKSKSKK